MLFQPQRRRGRRERNNNSHKSNRTAIERIDEMAGWTSPRLGINFQLNGTELQLTHPDGRIFETFDNVATERDSLLADNQRLEIEKQKRDSKLRELGIDPDTL